MIRLATQPAATGTRIVTLPGGVLDVRVDGGTWSLGALCDFAARRNPRRGFLIVSRVLGRHLPTPPDLMRRAAGDLAALVPTDLPGPVLVFGLAETAICLGQTVHEELRARTGRDDIFFLHSTRQRIHHPLLCRFEEPHSHASTHLVYRPDLPGFAPPRSLVLVDDEISTGRTLANVAESLVEVWPGVETIFTATLTDWSDRGWLADLPRPAATGALLNGRLVWTNTGEAEPSPLFDRSAPALGRLDRHRNDGRLGLRAPTFSQPATIPDIDCPIRIVGTGEFTYPPFRLAEQLARAGHDVTVQAAGRSPARLGGAIRTALRFGDNYGTGVPNYLYNVDSGDGRATWFCHETPPGSVDPDLVQALGARLVAWPA
jgi:hypothetical protein